MEIWLVRHGTTGANLEGRLQGRLEYPLNVQGRREALCVARRLKGQPFAAFFSSNQQRAKETADIISMLRKGPPPLFTALLQEYCWGTIQGLTRAEIQRSHPRIFYRLRQDFHHATIPGAEGLKRLFRRVKLFYSFLSRLEKKAGRVRRPILVVSHGRLLQAFIIYFLQYDYRRYWPFSLKPASLTILEGDFQKVRRLKLFNDTCHLRWEQGNPG
ncbi:MAG: histidine phosphatase family protein [Firmicutes bacterium]|jgi:broad specificity phosphatase PhoE|nr:histidine phosphatase family protein [Bacillota bacterium]